MSGEPEDCDCGPDEPPDPGEDCAPTNCTENTCLINDSTSRYGERRTNFLGTVTSAMVYRPYPEPIVQTKYDGASGVNLEYYSDYVLNPQWTSCADSWPLGKYDYQGTGGAMHSFSGYVHICSTINCNGGLWVDLWDGSSPYGSVQPPDVPVLIIQTRLFKKEDGSCVIQLRKFDYENSYAVDLNEIPGTNPYEEHPVPEEVAAADAAHPWTYEVALGAPVPGKKTISVPSAWLSGGVTGVDINIDCAGLCAPEPYNAAQTYSVSVSGGPSWAPSSFSGVSGKAYNFKGNLGRDLMVYAPNGGWAPGGYAPIQRKFEYTTTASNGLMSFDLSTCPSVSFGVQFYDNCTLNATLSYENGQPAPQYDYFVNDPGCQVLPVTTASANFTPDPYTSINNSVDSVTVNGVWTLYYDNDTQYSTVGDYPCYTVTRSVTYQSGTVTITRNACVGPQSAEVNVTMDGDSVGDITIAAGGQCYTSPPAITISGGGGSGATAYCDVANGHVTSVTITNKGSGYTSYPTVSPFTTYGLAFNEPVLMDTPCNEKDCEGHVATWIGEPVGDKGEDEKYSVEWSLIDDCPGACCSLPPCEPSRISSPVFVKMPCKCKCE